MAASSCSASVCGFGSAIADTLVFLIDRPPACSYFVLMESSGPARRFPPPWRVKCESKDAFKITDANGITVAWVYCRDHLHQTQFDRYWEHLTSDEARRIAKGIARLPEFLMLRKGFYPRGSGMRWKASRPYHVALEDSYVRERWDYINIVCKLNGLPFNATGERIGSGAVWCVYEFELQLDAMQFWDQFEGRWLRGSEFVFPERPHDLPKLKKPELKNSGRNNGWL